MKARGVCQIILQAISQKNQLSMDREKLPKCIVITSRESKRSKGGIPLTSILIFYCPLKKKPTKKVPVCQANVHVRDYK